MIKNSLFKVLALGAPLFWSTGHAEEVQMVPGKAVEQTVSHGEHQASSDSQAQEKAPTAEQGEVAKVEQSEVAEAEQTPQGGSKEVAVATGQENFTLEVTKEQGKIIEEIITTMGTSSVIGLGFKRGHLKALGKKLDGVGPLQFLGYIFSREDLKKQMKSIRNSSMKWNGFMDGLKPGLEKEVTSNQLFVKLPGFCKVVCAPQESLEKRAQERDWDGFVTVLIKDSD